MIEKIEGIEARSRWGWLFLPLMSGFLFLLYLDGAMEGDRSTAFIRKQFLIPDELPINNLNGGKKHPVCYTNATVGWLRVQFSPEQFSRYWTATDRPEIWKPLPPAHLGGEQSRFSFAEDALQWRDLPAPPYYGSQQLVYKIGGEDVREGRQFCYDISPLNNPPAAPVGDAKPSYSVTACGAVKRAKTPAGGGQIKAVLDLEKRKLVIALHFDRKAAYCNNRITNWLFGQQKLAAN